MLAHSTSLRLLWVAKQLQMDQRARESSAAFVCPFAFTVVRVLKRQRGDLNPCGQSPMDFESITLATRSHCHVFHKKMRFVYFSPSGRGGRKEIGKTSRIAQMCPPPSMEQQSCRCVHGLRSEGGNGKLFFFPPKEAGEKKLERQAELHE